MQTPLMTALVLTFLILALAGALTLLPRCGRVGMRFTEVIARAPALDVVIAGLTWGPWLAAGLIAGWFGVLFTAIGQGIVLYGWMIAHEAVHREAARGPRIVHALNRLVGRWPNHAGLWVSILGLPALWAVRLTEIIGYYPLIWLLGFPRYRHGDWVNLSRHKFDGLVGHDLIWCLYCDWMTGVWSLGSEMLRNVESFWCPIRFDDAKKCENCRRDFPDLDNGWVASDRSMAEVNDLLIQKYGEGERGWFGHPTRLTVEGRHLASDAAEWDL